MIQLVKFGILDLETVSEGWREAKLEGRGD